MGKINTDTETLEQLLADPSSITKTDLDNISDALKYGSTDFTKIDTDARNAYKALGDSNDELSDLLTELQSVSLAFSAACDTAVYELDTAKKELS